MDTDLTPPLSERIDIAAQALHRIHTLAGIQTHHMLDPEELSLISALIYENAADALIRL